MRWRDFLGISERRWTKKDNEEIRPAKTLWDFLQLLFVPLMLVLIAYLFNAAQAQREQKREENARQDEILDAYVSQISNLILERKLLHSKRGSNVRQVARMFTLSTVRRLDEERKGEAIRFLADTNLLGTPNIYTGARNNAIVNLTGADLSGADLTGTSLDGFFDGADLRGARFDEGFVSASFGYADLQDASFRNTRFYGADFSFAVLTRAVFDEASFVNRISFYNACLDKTSFVRAGFSTDANFGLAEARGIDFTDAFGLDFLDVGNAAFTNVRWSKNSGRPEGWRDLGQVSGVVWEETQEPCAPRTRKF